MLRSLSLIERGNEYDDDPAVRAAAPKRGSALRDAADEIERLRAALKPFANMATDPRINATYAGVLVQVDLIERAAEVLK